MTGLPFTDPVSTPAVRTPRLIISQQQSGGGPGGLADAAGALLGEGQGGDPWMDYLIAMRMQLGTGNQVDHVILHLLEGDAAPEAALGDTLEISLGYGDDTETLIFTGSVERLETTVAGYRRLTLTCPFLALAHKRVNTSYEEQSADDIIQSLLGETDVEAGNIDSGVQYPFYVVSDRRSLLEHIQQLCAQQNWLCYCGPDGKLNAHAASGAEDSRTFAYGSDVIELEHGTRNAALGGVKVIGGGAATSNGADAWNWLTKDPKVVSESGDASRVVPVRALRDAEGAQNYSGSLVARDAEGGDRIRLLTSAAPEVLPGKAFTLEGLPSEAANGTYVAERVIVTFDRSLGFRSSIAGFNRDAGGGGLGGLL